MTIVVGFSPAHVDQASVELGAMLARSRSGDLLLVSVVPAPWPTPVAGHTDREFERWSAQRGQQAVDTADRLIASHCTGVPTRAIWVHGKSVASSLLAQAQEHDAEMIVVGSATHGAWGHIVVSTTSDRLLHSSPVSVAIAPRGFRAPVDTEAARVRRATCVFRGDETSLHTMRLTAEICAQVGARLRLATFAVRGATMYPPEVSGAEQMITDRWVEQATAAQAAALPSLQGSGIEPGDVDTVVGLGRDWGHALDAVDWQAGDVLVIGSSPERSRLPAVPRVLGQQDRPRVTRAGDRRPLSQAGPPAGQGCSDAIRSASEP